MAQKMNIGNRIKKNYEDRYRLKLTRRTPVIMRLDGKSFHTLTKTMEKPFDDNFIKSMKATAKYLLREIQGAKMAYVQSDEISILITDYDELESDAWFDYNIQKMCSVSASICSCHFTDIMGVTGYFDSRVFNIPKEEVANYFIWRQLDWERNSLSMFARSLFKQKELNHKKRDEVHEMLFTKGKNWAKLSTILKNGTILVVGKDENDKKIIIEKHYQFKQNRKEIESMI